MSRRQILQNAPYTGREETVWHPLGLINDDHFNWKASHSERGDWRPHTPSNVWPCLAGNFNLDRRNRGEKGCVAGSRRSWSNICLITLLPSKSSSKIIKKNNVWSLSPKKVIDQALWMANNTCKTQHFLLLIANFFFWWIDFRRRWIEHYVLFLK